MSSPISMGSSTPTSRRAVSCPAAKCSSPDPQIEVLFNLPSARVISFTTANITSRPSSSNGGSPAVEPESGTLSWASRFERTIAIGSLRIYRAPGSVAFLSCSNALRPILPKSQCWEVDGGGKFVLQIRRPQYWRIEVPVESNIERAQAEGLKEVLAKILLFEKTPCPFRRDFTVELPEPPETPVKKKPWRPVERLKLEMTPMTTDDNGNASGNSILQQVSKPNVTTPVTARMLHNVTSEATAQFPQDSDSRAATPGFQSNKQTEVTEDGSDYTPVASSSKSMLSNATSGCYHKQGVDDSPNCLSEDPILTLRSFLQPAFQSMAFESEKEIRPQALKNCSRSITAPPMLSLITSPPSKQRNKSPLASAALLEDSDFSSSVDSFHSVQSWHSLGPPSPPASGSSSPTMIYPYPNDNIVLPKRHDSRDVPERTTTLDTPQVWELSPKSDMNDIPLGRISLSPRTPTSNDNYGKSADEKFEITTPPNTRPSIRHRATTSSNSRRRTLSPLPAAVNLFSPPRRRSRRLQTARHLPTAIIQKTCEILLSPPSHLLQFMLNIASKIAAGEWKGVLSGYGEAVHWDFEDDYAWGEWHEDDYGVKLGRPASTSGRRNSNTFNGSWEID